MEAPEKIYMTPLFGEPDNVSVASFSKSHLDYHRDIEYTRTDTFIEKACVKLKKLMYDNLMFQGRLHREEVIDNFVEDFRNYMKGESLRYGT